MITNSQVITLGKHIRFSGDKIYVTKYPLKNLIEELGSQLSKKEHLDVVLNNGKGKQFPITPSEFCEIPSINNPRKIAFIDGGDGPLEESPNFLIAINRVYFSLFQGKKRIQPKKNPRIQFFSSITTKITTVDGKKNVGYETKLFPYTDEDRKYLPLESDLKSTAESTTVLQGAKLTSLGRIFAEWKLAIHVVETELEKGDLIVIDGSLQTNIKNELKYAKKLYNLASSKGIIVCGLAKTSRLITESGDPLLARIAEISEDVKHKKWYVKVAEEISSDNQGFMFAVKFHPQSKFLFRFEILREQYNQMTPDELNSVMASLAENSQDVAMLGYPYGAIDADRFAQVRRDELIMYQGYLTSEKMRHPIWERLQKYSVSLDAHDVLNGVTS